MTNSMNITDAMAAAHKLSEQSDRYAFFASLIILGGILGFSGLWALRHLVAQNKELVEALKDSHDSYTAELKAIVAKNHGVIEDNTKATVQQIEANRASTEVIRMATAELELHRRMKHIQGT
jgi:hypothetical protein